jgi:hypothetical protein
MQPPAQFVHDVYFTLSDNSAESQEALINDCYEKLAGIEGVLFLAAGTRDTELVRDVNDRDYDVSLHVFFTDRASHDAYQDAPDHLAFIEANKHRWQDVRVFDSAITGR